jgi:hypothetical protein
VAVAIAVAAGVAETAAGLLDTLALAVAVAVGWLADDDEAVLPASPQAPSMPENERMVSRERSMPPPIASRAQWEAVSCR